jgi:hypothetical protein
MTQAATKLNPGIILGGFIVLLTPGSGDADVNTPFGGKGIYFANVDRYVHSISRIQPFKSD